MNSQNLGEFSGTRRRKEEKVSILLDLYSSYEFFYFRTIQGHSGDIFVGPLLQDNVLLWDDFAEYIYHIGNAYEMHSIVESGLISGGKSNRKDRQSVFFRAVNPMDDNQDLEEVQDNLHKPRIAPYKHTWRSHQNTVFWCNLKLAQRKGLRFYQTRSYAITLSDTLPAICIDKVVCMKTREELHCRICKSLRLPRVTLVPNSQHVQKVALVSESRKSDDRENEVHQHRETCGGDHCVDFRILGIPHSAVEQVERYRKEKVRRLIEQFESHPNRNMLLKDFENRRRSTTSVKNRRIWLLKCATTKSSSSTRLLRRDNVRIALHVGNLVSCSALAENACSLRQWIDNTTKTDVTHCGFLDTK